MRRRTPTTVMLANASIHFQLVFNMDSGFRQNDGA
jgi:hypothetical protein